MTHRRGNLIVLSAPSGTGKTTVLHRALSRLDEIAFSVSYTTRARRPTEREGVDYHFVAEEVFREKIHRNELLEWAEVHGNLYGTGRSETEAIRARGEDVLADVDVQGAEQVRRAQRDAVTIFMLPPSFEVLAQRLRGREQDAPESIARRLETARREVARWAEYDYLIVNDEVERAADHLRAIVLAERARPGAMEKRVQSIVDSFP